MSRQTRWKGFYFITDSGLSENGVIEDSRLALSAGIAMLQFREKSRIALPEIFAEAEAIKKLCREAAVPFIINDDLDMALKVGADGVHLGQQDAPPQEARRILGPKGIIGVSVANIEEARIAEDAGADYVAVSPVFATSTKLDAGPGLGIETIRAVRKSTGLTVAAIGGINRDNVRQVIEAGADLICAISASLAGGTVRENIINLITSNKK